MALTIARRGGAQQQVIISRVPDGPLPPPPTPLQRHAVDVSNYTSFLSTQAVYNWRDQHDIGLVIVQSLDSERFPSSRTIQQLIACQSAGMTVDLYVYPFYANGVDDCARRLNEAKKAGVSIRRVWLDVEDVDPSQAAWTPAQRVDMVRKWLDACDAYDAYVKPAGIYTGSWYWRPYLANSTAFSARPLWTSQYDGIDDPNVVTLYGGWQRAAVKQYIGTSSLGGITGVDQNVLSDAERALN